MRIVRDYLRMPDVVPVILPAHMEELIPLIFGYPVPADDYTKELDSRFTNSPVERGTPLAILVTKPEYLAWCAANSLSPQGAANLDSYAASRVEDGWGIPVEGDISLVLQNYDCEQELSNILRETHGGDFEDALLQLEDVAASTVATIVEYLPVGGRIRLLRRNPDHANQRFDLVGPDDAEDSLLEEERSLLQSEIILGMLQGGWLLSECTSDGEWAFFAWFLGGEGTRPVDNAEIGDLVTDLPQLFFEGMDPTRVTVAPDPSEEAEPHETFCAWCGGRIGDSTFCGDCGREAVSFAEVSLDAVPLSPPNSFGMDAPGFQPPGARTQQSGVAGPPHYQPYFVAPRTSGFAIASLVLGILWFAGVGAILAIIFGYSANKEIQQSNGTIQGQGLATAGIILGWIGVVGSILWIILLVALAHAATNPYP